MQNQLADETHREYYSTGSYPKERYVWIVATFLGDCAGKRVVEVGCGDGALLALLKSHCEVQGVEASESGIAACAARGIPVHHLDASNAPLPFSDRSFDIVVCLETLEHLTDPYHALTEMRRVLRPEGRLICSVPNPLWGHLMIYPGLFRFKNFKQFLEQCGFRILRVKPWQYAPRELILPGWLRGVRLLRSRYIAGALRRVIERLWLTTGAFPAFCYWLWTFECARVMHNRPSILERQMIQTRPKGPGNGA